MSFTQEERAYLATQPLARFASTSPDEQPDVVPVAFELDGDAIWIGGPGDAFCRTRKVRNIISGRRQVALVIDDLVSFDPFVARGIRIYGQADDPIERVGLIGPGWYVRITPTVSWNWNLQGLPAGEDWYPTHRNHHGQSASQ